MKKFIIYLLLVTWISACQPVQEGFKLQKKDNSDEFLVEKKNPLVMPPNYEDLPRPEDFQSKKQNQKDDEFEKIISNKKIINTKTNKKKTSIEESVIDKIN